MSTTITAVIAQLLVIFLPMFGITLGSDQLTGLVQTLTIIATGLWIWFRRVQAGGVSTFGVRK